MLLVTSNQMRTFDKHTIQTLCVPGIVLMELAGKAVAKAVAARRPGRVSVLCGKGNNGGDGWVAARWLRHWGIDVEAISLTPPETLAGDAATAYRSAAASGVPVHNWPDEGHMGQADLIVDAMLGTKSGRAPYGVALSAIERIAALAAPVIAVDVPSGVDASTGEVPGAAVKAAETVTIGYCKLGLMVTPGALYAGKVTVADIGIEAPAEELAEIAQLTTEAFVQRAIVPRLQQSHKGTYGRLGIRLGDMHGAAMLAGIGAARVGAGLVVIGGDVAKLKAVPYEFVLRDRTTADPFVDCTAMVVGPGLGSERIHTAALLAGFTGPGVIDADGLHPDVLPLHLDGHFVLTPHPKECARLLGWTASEVNDRRVLAARTLAESRQAVVVLKGFHSVVATPSGRLWVNPTGGPALATAGTGDVLAGIIGGLLAQGLAPEAAAVAGVWIHGRAGDLAAETMHPASVMAMDVVDNISRAIPLHFDKDDEDTPRLYR